MLVVTRSYPSADDLYQYPFVHRRVLAYRALGHDVAVFRFDPARPEGRHVFEGVPCETGGVAALRAAAAFGPDVVALHGLSEVLWPALAALGPDVPVCAWLHGSEIPHVQRIKAVFTADPVERAAHFVLAERRVVFWREALARWPRNLRIAFVSAASREAMRDDLGGLLQDGRVEVLHNPIDTRLFAYRPKTPAHRLRILSIRPYHMETYGNDLAVAAILALRDRSWFADLAISFLGDGPLFERVLAPLRGLPNVSIERGFLPQPAIAARHGDHGVFLVPTRLDTQGVSRDEAMASGLVPVTNAVEAVPEFVDSSCAALAGDGDVPGLAGGIAEMIEDPALFLARSAAAAARVRRQSAEDIIVPRELAWMREGMAAHA